MYLLFEYLKKVMVSYLNIHNIIIGDHVCFGSSIKI